MPGEPVHTASARQGHQIHRIANRGVGAFGFLGKPCFVAQTAPHVSAGSAGFWPNGCTLPYPPPSRAWATLHEPEGRRATRVTDLFDFVPATILLAGHEHPTLGRWATLSN